MDDGESLLKAILACPEDDTVRLVYADWLQENGEGDRAEFIRVQVRIAQLNAEAMSDEDCESPHCVICSERRPLAARERELLSPDEKAEPGGWHEPIPHNGAIGWAFRRGFVAEVTCSPGDWLEHNEAIVSRHPVEKVVMTERRDRTLRQLLAARHPRIKFEWPTITGTGGTVTIGGTPLTVGNWSLQDAPPG